ncbi:uncharacterized protein PG998_011558 [Apiospora kogelbergensis]|uniref:uncharacterized protein n=1 Tax=Apiospora kogelbergensis TaxID=1337665 RepID=UPI00312DBD8F
MSSANPTEQPRLACHFVKAHQMNCLVAVSGNCIRGFKTMSALHQHLKTVHLKEGESGLQGPIDNQRIKDDVKAWYARANKRMPIEEKWFGVYKTLFPGAYIPRDPYNQPLHELLNVDPDLRVLVQETVHHNDLSTLRLSDVYDNQDDGHMYSHLFNEVVDADFYIYDHAQDEAGEELADSTFPTKKEI